VPLLFCSVGTIRLGPQSLSVSPWRSLVQSRWSFHKPKRRSDEWLCPSVRQTLDIRCRNMWLGGWGPVLRSGLCLLTKMPAHGLKAPSCPLLFVLADAALTVPTVTFKLKCFDDRPSLLNLLQNCLPDQFADQWETSRTSSCCPFPGPCI